MIACWILGGSAHQQVAHWLLTPSMQALRLTCHGQAAGIQMNTLGNTAVRLQHNQLTYEQLTS